MGFISFLLMQFVAAYTVLVEPLLRTNFYRNLKKQIQIDSAARILFYRTQILWEWSWVVVLAVILIPQSDRLGWIGLTIPGIAGWIIMAALVLGIFLSTVLLRRNPHALAAMQRSLQATSSPLPVTSVERKWFAAVAITAGICEELLYRGFLLRYLSIYFYGLGWLFSSIISGIIYGLGHAYQGRRSLMQSTMNGFAFAIVYYLSGNLFLAIGSSQPVVLVGSLLPAMVFHTLAELRPLLLWQPEEKTKKGR